MGLCSMHSYHKTFDPASLRRLFCLFFFALLLLIASSCGGTSEITPVALHVTRSSPLRPLPPLNMTITDKKAVQALYQAAYNLPLIDGGTQSCSVDLGIVYHLDFIEDKSTSENMDLQVTGCLHLTTTQGVRQANNAFLDLVARTIHVNPLVPHRSSGPSLRQPHPIQVA